MAGMVDKQTKKILLLEGIHDVAKSNLESSGYYVELLKPALSEEELISKLPGFDVVGIRSKTQITKKVLDAHPSLFAVGCFCIGTNQVDLEAANRVATPVFNAPYSNTRSVAELVLAEMVCLSRKIAEISMKAHNGVWQKSAKGSFEVRGKTVGIVGYGHIGSQVSVLAESMGMRVVYYDIIKKLPLGNADQVDSLEELLKNSDFVTLHVPETEETKNMICSEQLKIMKKGSYLINASRGSVVDISALASALKEGHIAGAAVDVFPSEPKDNNELFKSELQGIENVILTPHIGGSTEEAQVAIGREVSESIIRFLEVGSTTGAVNFPNVELPVHKNCHRILNIHSNVPGVLGKINNIVSEIGANIQAQYLSTDPTIGYLVMDMERADAKLVADRVAALPTSLQTRILF